MRRMSYSKFADIFRALKCSESERRHITIEDVSGLIFEHDMTFGDFYETNSKHGTVQLYEEAKA